MWIITVFSFLAGVNFSLMFLAVRGKLKTVLRSEELRVYVGVVVCTTLLLCLNLYVQADVPFGQSVTDAAFQTVTIISTTGYATVDFALWPTFCRMALVMLMFTGACAGSTSGGMTSAFSVDSPNSQTDTLIYTYSTTVAKGSSVSVSVDWNYKGQYSGQDLDVISSSSTIF